MAEYAAHSWKRVFIDRCLVDDQGQLMNPDTARHVTVSFAKHDHKLSELELSDDLTLAFKHGHFLSVYLWSDIEAISVFRP